MKTAIITGGGTGIGRATGERLLTDGYQVIAAGMDKDEDLSAQIRFVQVDVTVQDDLRELMALPERIDTLVNCAGVIRQSREWEIEDFRFVVETNLTASFNAAMVALDKLGKARGSIVNIASMWSFFGSPGCPAYSASKGAITSLTRSMAVAWGGRGIRVNAVAPGWIDTRMAQTAKNDPERSARINARISLGRWGNTAEVANAIRFLVSDEASYVHGVTLPVDGGYSVA